VSDQFFTPGVELCGAFYVEAVRPLLAGRPHAAALLGWGSDVLGYDTARSTDHGWGPRLLVVLDQPDEVEQVERLLASGLPDRFRGWPVRFGWDAVPVTHHVHVTTLPAWLLGHLGVDATAGLTTLDWLITPQQRLLEVAAGRVYADDSGALSRVRRTLSWYPEQVWRWLLACQWRRLAHEEAFVARAAEVGDEAGSAVIAGRLVRDMMRLVLLLERRYAPYQKWLGTAFGRANHADGLPRKLTAVLHVSDPPARSSALAEAWSALADRHNAAALTAPVDPSLRDYHGRPARVLMADRFTEACLATVDDPFLRSLPLIGSVDQVVDNTAVLQAPQTYRALAALYAGP
jgi:Domain of unknown function (DUF4037)